RRSSHELQCLLYLLLRHNVQKGRLLQIDGEGLLECSVKDGIAGGVGEIREQNRVLLRDGVTARRAEVEGTCDDQQHERGEGDENFPHRAARAVHVYGPTGGGGHAGGTASLLGWRNGNGG